MNEEVSSDNECWEFYLGRGNFEKWLKKEQEKRVCTRCMAHTVSTVLLKFEISIFQVKMVV